MTDFTATPLNVLMIMRGGRARWKIENETFNTLKNQGYHFEHNFGHGQNHLSVVFAVLKKKKRLIRVREQLRALFDTLEFKSTEELYYAILYGYRVQVEIGASQGSRAVTRRY